MLLEDFPISAIRTTLPAISDQVENQLTINGMLSSQLRPNASEPVDLSDNDPQLGANGKLLNGEATARLRNIEQYAGDDETQKNRNPSRTDLYVCIIC